MNDVKKYSILNNSRFYVLTSSILISLVVVAWLRLHIPSTQLFYIRSEQIFGLLALFYWYSALIVSPMGQVIGKQRVAHMAFMRRAMGVSAAYFAVLHFVIALWGQLGGIDQIGNLPTLFKWSFAAGSVAMIVLIYMAATSFDRVVRFMTFRYWKWLHRTGYAAFILLLLHIWTIGTHASYFAAQAAALIGLIILTGLETLRTTKILASKYTILKDGSYFIVLFLSIWGVILAAIISVPSVIENYHNQRHTGHGQIHQKDVR